MYQSQTVIGHTLASKDLALADCRWPEDALHYIPDWAYTSNDVYDLEIERIFRGPTWNFVASRPKFPRPATTSAPTSARCRSFSRAPTTGRSTCSRTAAHTAAPSSAATARAIPVSSSARTTSGRTT